MTKQKGSKWLHPKFRIALMGILISIIIPGTNVYGQSHGYPVEITYERNKKGEVEFFATNRSTVPYVLSITFTDLENTLPPNPNPYLFTSRRGRERILTLNKYGMSNGNIGFGYKFTYTEGCHDTEPDEEIEYLIPVHDGKTTRVIPISYAGTIINQKAPEGFYALGFSAGKNDSVFASRRGTVIEVVDKFNITEEQEKGEAVPFYIADRNFITVIHEDCTIATYKWLEKGSPMVKEGDFVEAGDPLARVSSRGGNQGEGVLFSLMYKKFQYQGIRITGEWEYAYPLFRTETGEMIKLESDKEYLSVHPEEVITQEMSRREKRRWRRSH